MTNERTQAYGRVVQTLDELGPTKLLPPSRLASATPPTPSSSPPTSRRPRTRCATWARSPSTCSQRPLARGARRPARRGPPRLRADQRAGLPGGRCRTWSATMHGSPVRRLAKPGWRRRPNRVAMPAWRPARSGTARSPSGWSTCRSRSTRRPSPRASTSTRSTSTTARGSSTARVCPKEDKEVPNDEIVKGYELSNGKFVELTKDEIAAAAGERSKLIDVEHFVEGEEIDPAFYDKTYYLGAGDDGEDAYRLLRPALEKSGKVAIAPLGLPRPRAARRRAPARRQDPRPAHDELPRRGRRASTTSTCRARSATRPTARSRWRASSSSRWRRSSSPRTTRTPTARRSWS